MLAVALKFIKNNKFASFLFGIDFLLILLHIIFSAKYDFFNLDKEYNLPSFWSSLQFLFLSYFVFFTSILENVKIQKILKNLASLLFFYLALDEFFQFHERLGDLLGNYFNNLEHNQSIFSLNPVFAWLLIFTPIILMVLFIWFLIIRKYLDKKLFFKISIAIFIYILGAYGLEFLGWQIWQGNIHFSYYLEVLFEESLEILSISYLVQLLAKYKK